MCEGSGESWVSSVNTKCLLVLSRKSKRKERFSPIIAMTSVDPKSEEDMKNGVTMFCSFRLGSFRLEQRSFCVAEEERSRAMNAIYDQRQIVKYIKLETSCSRGRGCAHRGFRRAQRI